jgi:hypothetical protein
MHANREQGTTLVEMLVGFLILTVVMVGISGMMIQNLKVSSREQMRSEVQSNARNCISRVVNVLHSAGWDPGQHGIATLALDPDLSDSVSQIQAFVDLDGDGVTSGTAKEQILIRHVGDRVEWDTDGSGTFRVLAWNITNDADGDGTIEPMFTPDSTTDPTRILVQITAEASEPDPETGEPIRYTMASEVVLRKEL